MTTERIDPLAVMHDSAVRLRTKGCTEFATDLDAARLFVAELVEAGQRFFDAQCELDNRECAGPNAPPYDVLMRARNAARDDFDAALAGFGRQG